MYKKKNSALDITVKSSNMINLTNFRITPCTSTTVFEFVEGQNINLSAIDTELFLDGFFSQEAYEYLDDNWGNGCDPDDTVARWINSLDGDHWFDIRKDASGDYFCVAGDSVGVVYRVQIESIQAIYHDYVVRFNEDEDYYYIQFRNKTGEYLKSDWSLEAAIKDMERVLAED